MAAAARTLGPEAWFLVGADLQKAESILVPAYDDREGVTAAFNKNLLARINDELGANFDLAAFAHRAVYNRTAGRIEMHLVSASDQTVAIAGQSFEFAAGESIHTENSHKFTLDGFAGLADRAGFETVHAWTDDNGLFSIHLLRVRADA